MRVLFDGWSLIRLPGSPSALHLAAVLEIMKDDIQPVLALPGKPHHLDWLPPGLEVHVELLPDTPWEGLIWEQRALPQIARRIGAKALYLVGTRAPFLPRLPTLVSPSGWSLQEFGQLETQPQRRTINRLQAALGRGGVSQARGILWPADLPTPSKSIQLRAVPPLVHPLFRPVAQPIYIPDLPCGELPEAYLLYHGPLDLSHIEIILQAWGWAAGSIGTHFPLLLYGRAEQPPARLRAMIQQAGFSDSLFLLPSNTSEAAWNDPACLATLYQGCTALFHPAPISPWGDPVRHALACGKPVVAPNHPWSEALVGPAGYLISGHDPRQYGAALITLCVEEEMAQKLGETAARRALAWSAAQHKETLLSYLTQT